MLDLMKAHLQILKTLKETSSNKKKKTSSKKNKKPLDYYEYAQQKGINYNISYEDNFEKKQTNYQKKPENKEGPKTTPNNNSKKPQNYNNQGNTQNFYPKKQNDGNKKNFKKNNTSEFYQFNNQKTTGSNKFDVVPGGYMSNPYYNQQYNNPEIQQNYGSNNEYYNQNMQKHLEEDNSTDPDTRICNTLNYYFSIENLNQNYHIRSLLDNQGFVLAEEIMNFNKMKNNAVTLEKIQEILKKFDTTIDQVVIDKKLYLRNKNWDNIKDKLVSIESIKQDKSNKNKTKYVNYQNNYFIQFNPYQMGNPYQQQQIDPMMIPQTMMNNPMMMNLQQQQYQQYLLNNQFSPQQQYYNQQDPKNQFVNNNNFKDS